MWAVTPSGESKSPAYWLELDPEWVESRKQVKGQEPNARAGRGGEVNQSHKPEAEPAIGTRVTEAGALEQGGLGGHDAPTFYLP